MKTESKPVEMHKEGIARKGTEYTFTPENETDTQFLINLCDVLDRPEFRDFKTAPIKFSGIMHEGSLKEDQNLEYLAIILYDNN